MLQFHDGGVYGVAAHPAQAFFATAGHSGLVQLWDYDAQALRASRRFDKLMGHRLAFDPTGEFIGIPSPPSSFPRPAQACQLCHFAVRQSMRAQVLFLCWRAKFWSSY
jgi:hypothetical protein